MNKLNSDLRWQFNNSTINNLICHMTRDGLNDFLGEIELKGKRKEVKGTQEGNGGSGGFDLNRLKNNSNQSPNL